MKIKILVVDDDKSIRDMLELILGMDGHEITTATGATEGIRLLERNDYDLLITDNDMPQRNEGMKVVEFAKDLPFRPHIVWMSGRASTDPSLQQKARDLGADDTLPKPFHLKEISGIADQVCIQKAMLVVPV